MLSYVRFAASPSSDVVRVTIYLSSVNFDLYVSITSDTYRERVSEIDSNYFVNSATQVN